MRYRLPRQIVKPLVASIVTREMNKLFIDPIRPTRKNLKQMNQVVQVIQKKGLPDNLIRKKLPCDLGYGIFLHPAAEPIEKGQVIAPYSGEVSIGSDSDFDDSSYAFSCFSGIRLLKKEHRLVDKKKPYHPRRQYELKLDAEKKGNFTRFINHSDQPNVIAELVKIPPNAYGLKPAPAEIVFFALETIQPGEQLLVSYEAEKGSYWGSMDIKPFRMTPQTFCLTPKLRLKTRF